MLPRPALPSRFSLVAAGLLMLAAGLAQQLGATAPIDRLLLDATLRFNRAWHPQPVSQDPVIVGIDEAFLDSIDEPMALSHVYLSRFLQAMVQARPAVVGLDLVLPEKRFQAIVPATQPTLDYHRTLLAALLTTSRELPLVSAKVWDPGHGRFREIQFDYASALGLQDRGHAAQGSAEFCQDADGSVRRYPDAACQPGATEATLTSAMAAAMGRRREWSGLIDYQLGPPFAYVPIQRVLEMAARGDEAQLRAQFAGRAVLLGAVLDDIDMLVLPVPLASWRADQQRVPGVVAHAQVLRSMLNRGFVQPAPPWLLVLLSCAFAGFWFGAALIRKFALLGVAALGLLWLASQLLLTGYWLAPGGLLAVAFVACVARGLVEGWRNWLERRRLGHAFSGYVSPQVMREIVGGGIAADQRGRKLEVCVLFSDIRDFTTLSEHMPAEEVVALLNRYFARMTAAVHRHDGTVDKFIGDGLMAFFGAPKPLACASRNALAAAQEMLQALADLNRELAAEERAPLAIGIGLHSGEAVIGHVGSPERHAYTAIGDTVNTAARLEGLCKTLHHPILCSDSVARAVGFPLYMVPLGAQALKGRSAIEVYGVRPEAHNAADAPVAAAAGAHEQAIVAAPAAP
jgi:adenylate cyclase